VNLEILVDRLHQHKEHVSAVGDVDVRRRLAQFDAGDRGSLGECSAMAMVLRQNSLELVNELLLHGTNRHTDSCQLDSYCARQCLYIRQQKPPPLGSTRRPRSTSIQNVDIWSEKFRRLQSDPVELAAAECSRLVFNSNSVLYASEDCSVQ